MSVTVTHILELLHLDSVEEDAVQVVSKFLDL